MRTTFIAVATIALGSFANGNLSLGRVASLHRRQAFDPSETTGTGANCVEAFGPGYIECRPKSDSDNRLCINPNEGETCCQSLWGCPSGSFCLIQDLCCPDGLDPAACAAQNGVTLPAGFTPATKTADNPLATAGDPLATATSPSNTGSTTTRETATPRPDATSGAHQEPVGVAAAVLGLFVAFVV